MSDNRKYYYLKLKENFFTTEKMVILESAQDGLLYSNLLLKMYLMSLKHNGVLMLGDGLPHTPQTIATFTRHQIGTVERALKLFTEFGFLHGRHPAFDRPVLHRGRTEEERADAPETPEAAPIRTDGQMSTI